MARLQGYVQSNLSFVRKPTQDYEHVCVLAEMHRRLCQRESTIRTVSRRLDVEGR